MDISAPVPGHLAWVFVVGALFAGALPVIAWAWLYEHILPRKPWWQGLEPKSLHRRHLESFSKWEKRYCDAMKEYRDSERAMMESPDAVHRQVSARGWTYSLPFNHPLCVRRLAALYPEGPPLRELEELAGVRHESLSN
jgi:hypothetical protein